MRQLQGYTDRQLQQFFQTGQGITGKGDSEMLKDFDLTQIFGSGEFLSEILESDNEATKEYVRQLDQMVSGFVEIQILEEKLAGLNTAFTTATNELNTATANVANAQAAVANPAANPAIAAPGGPTAGLPTAGGGPALPAEVLRLTAKVGPEA